MPETETNPDLFLHAFRTFLGMPADTTLQPACGATITLAYDFPNIDRPTCPACKALVDGAA